jgi:hypothetical protein
MIFNIPAEFLWLATGLHHIHGCFSGRGYGIRRDDPASAGLRERVLVRICNEENRPMSVASRPAMPVMPVRQPTFRARRERLVSRLATYITVLTAVIAVLSVAAGTVALTIT